MRRAAQAVLAGLRVGRLETVPRVLAVERDEEHRAGRDEAPARVQAAEPGVGVEAPVEMDVDPAEAERDRVDARGRPRRRPQAEAAVEQRVVVLEAEVDPAPLGEAPRVALDLHVRRPAASPKSRKRELGPPDVVVRQLEQVDRHDRDQRHRPGPVVLVQLDQRPLAMGPRGDRADRRHAQVERRLVVEHEERAEGVRLPCRR